jgi:CBS domain-containing protein
MSIRAILEVKGRRVVTISSETPIREVVQTMTEERIGAVVVSDDGVTVAGMLSERDVMSGLAEHGAALLDLQARDLMTRHVTAAKIDMPLLHVLDLMTQGRFRHMPVVDNGRLSGIVSIGDAVKARLDMLEAEAHSLKEYIGGH